MDTTGNKLRLPDSPFLIAIAAGKKAMDLTVFTERILQINRYPNKFM